MPEEDRYTVHENSGNNAKVDPFSGRNGSGDTKLQIGEGEGNIGPQMNQMKTTKTRKFKVLRFGCLNMKVEEDMDGNIDMQAVAIGDTSDPLPPPSQLIVTVNGIIGRADNWKFAAKQFLRKYPQHVVVHCSKANHGRLTFDGVDVMGDRLANEVLSVIRRHDSLKKISFVGHSLGGLIARYAIAKLYDDNTGKIAGLEALNFISFATPHLGSRGHNQVPLFGGLHALESIASRLSWFLGRTGKHLFLADGKRENPPLLVRMASDTPNLKFLSALQCFKRRVAYSNVRFDQLVGWSTSSLRPPIALPKVKSLASDPKYRHVVHLTSAEDSLKKQSEEDDKSNHFEEEMMRSLTKLSWERVDVKFNGPKQRFLAHNTIQVQNNYLYSKGVDVIQHLVDTFAI